ncbi:hypothetical protein [Streptomyces sp. NPDC001380]|uniref:hypothetical protein n=1 Tax=Streptomyces sp. NPDC001380 TaxID=3364566 RepID=UPI00367E059C
MTTPTKKPRTSRRTSRRTGSGLAVQFPLYALVVLVAVLVLSGKASAPEATTVASVLSGAVFGIRNQQGKRKRKGRRKR